MTNTSHLGTRQYHYSCADGAGVVVIPSRKAVYVYPTDADGEADLTAVPAVFPAGTAPRAALRTLGYEAVAS